jgi:hypothetical protein
MTRRGHGEPTPRGTTRPPNSTPDHDLLNQGSGDARPPAPDDDLDGDLLNGGSGEDEPSPENEPPIERSDGQVYGG